MNILFSQVHFQFDLFENFIYANKKLEFYCIDKIPIKSEVHDMILLPDWKILWIHMSESSIPYGISKMRFSNARNQVRMKTFNSLINNVKSNLSLLFHWFPFLDFVVRYSAHMGASAMGGRHCFWGLGWQPYGLDLQISSFLWWELLRCTVDICASEDWWPCITCIPIGITALVQGPAYGAFSIAGLVAVASDVVFIQGDNF